jgi:hypothetical protein
MASKHTLFFASQKAPLLWRGWGRLFLLFLLFSSSCLVAQSNRLPKKNNYTIGVTYNYDAIFDQFKESFYPNDGGAIFTDTFYTFFRPHHSVAIIGTVHHRLSKYFRADVQVGVRTWGFEGWHYVKQLPNSIEPQKPLHEIEFTKQTYLFASLGAGLSFENSQMRLGAQLHVQQYLGGQARVSTEQLSATGILVGREHRFISQETRVADTRAFHHTLLSQSYYLDHILTKRLWLTLGYEHSLGYVFRSSERYLPMPLRVWSVGMKVKISNIE